MKRILVILILIFNVNVFASGEVNFNVECNKLSVKRGESITCDLKTSTLSTINIDNINLDLDYHNDLEVSYNKSQDFDGSINNKRLLLSSDSLKTGNFSIGTLTILVSNSASFGEKNLDLKNIQSADSNNITQIYDTPNVSKTITVLSDDNNLKSISVDGNSLTNFSADTLKYRIETNASKVKIDAIAEAGNLAKIEGLGEKELEYGDNNFTIKVTSQAGSVKTYTLTIVRPDNRSNINSLKTLTLDAAKFNFKSETLEYKIDVESSVEKIKITSTLTDKKSSYVKDFGNREVALKYGENEVLVKVQSEKGEVRTYTLKINRADNRSDVAKLTYLKINGEEINVQDGIYEYSLSLRHKHTKTIVEAKANEGATLKYEDIDLKVGDNKLVIKVISEKETEVEYKINIKRLTPEESKIGIKDILIEGYTLNFTKDITTYNLKVNNDTKVLKITVLPDEEEVIHSVLGNNNLTNGSVVTINVKDDFGEYIYTINILKDKEENLILGFLTIEQLCYIIFSLGALSFICSIIYYIKNKKSKIK